MKRFPKKILVPICILIVAIMIGAVWYFSLKRQYQNYQPATATVTKFWVTHSSRTKAGSRSAYYHWQYQYSVNGAMYLGEDMYAGNSGKSNVGDTVTVWYDPNNPGNSTMNTNVSLNFVGPLFLAVPLMLGAYRFFLIQEKKRKES